MRSYWIFAFEWRVRLILRPSSFGRQPQMTQWVLVSLLRFPIIHYINVHLICQRQSSLNFCISVVILLLWLMICFLASDSKGWFRSVSFTCEKDKVAFGVQFLDRRYGSQVVVSRVLIVWAVDIYRVYAIVGNEWRSATLLADSLDKRGASDGLTLWFWVCVQVGFRVFAICFKLFRLLWYPELGWQQATHICLLRCCLFEDRRAVAYS